MSCLRKDSIKGLNNSFSKRIRSTNIDQSFLLIDQIYDDIRISNKCVLGVNFGHLCLSRVCNDIALQSSKFLSSFKVRVEQPVFFRFSTKENSDSTKSIG